jgi:8-amino-7-oxononanoate synthase
MPLGGRINRNLDDLARRNRLRSITNTYELQPRENMPILDLSTNDYLGLAVDPRIPFSLQETRRLGTSASRVLCYNLELHAELEIQLAHFTGFESSLLFGSGYLANIGVLSCLIERHDYVISDKYIHASLLDGIRLSMASHHRVLHNSLSHFESELQKISRQRKDGQEVFLVTESVFSMDGDFAPVEELYALAKKHDATLILDEAHALGVFGGGLLHASGLDPSTVILLGTLSKSLGSYGGFVSAGSRIKEYLISSARSFLFSTALPEVLIEGALGALLSINKDSFMGARVLERSHFFREQLRKFNLEVEAEGSHIVPIPIGDEREVLRIASALKEKGIFVSAIRPPTVPSGTSRLRCSVTLGTSNELLEWGAKEISNEIHS